MAFFKIQVRAELKPDIEQAFLAMFSNPDQLEPEDLVVKYATNYIKDILNQYKEKLVVEQAKSSFEKETKLD